MPFGSAGEIRFGISIDDANAINKLQSVGQQFETLGNSTQQTTQQMNDLPPALQEIKDGFKNAEIEIASMQKELEKQESTLKKTDNATKSFGSTLKSNIINIVQIGTGILGLVSNYRNLEKTQLAINKASILEANQRRMLDILTRKHADAVLKYGAASQEALDIENKIVILEGKHTNTLDQIRLKQESLTESQVNFGFSLISTGTGILQAITGLKSMGGAADAAKVKVIGLSSAMRALKIASLVLIPLVALEVASQAIANNWGGFRDWIENVRKSLEKLIPMFKPVIDFIWKVGESVTAVMTGEFEKLPKIWDMSAEGAQSAIEGMDDFGESAAEAGRKITELNQTIFEFGKTGTQLLVEASKGDKSDQRDFLKSLGIKGNEKEKMRDVLDDIEDAVNETQQAASKLESLKGFNILEKLGFDIPDGVIEDIQNTIDSDLRDIISGDNDPFNKLADILEKSPDKETYSQILSEWVAKNPDLLEALRQFDPRLASAIESYVADIELKTQTAINNTKLDYGPLTGILSADGGETKNKKFGEMDIPETLKKLPKVQQDVVLNLTDSQGNQLLPGGATGGWNLHAMVFDALNQLFNVGAWHDAISKYMGTGTVVKGILTDVWNQFRAGISKTPVENYSQTGSLTFTGAAATVGFLNSFFNAGGWHDAIKKHLESTPIVGGILADIYNQLSTAINTMNGSPAATGFDIVKNAIQGLFSNEAEGFEVTIPLKPNFSLSGPGNGAYSAEVETDSTSQLQNLTQAYFNGIDPVSVPVTGNIVKVNDVPGSGGGAFSQTPGFKNGTQLKIAQVPVQGVIQNVVMNPNNDKKGSTNPFASMAVDAARVHDAVLIVFNHMASSISKINSAIASSWGKVVNKNTENTASGISDIVSRYNKMASSISKINLAIAKSWSKTMNQNITNTVAAVKRINSELDKIKDKDVTVTTHHVDVFANGGIVKAAGGLMTSNGPRTIMIGDNPGGKETLVAIPHNNPDKWVELINQMFPGHGSTLMRGGSGPSGGGGGSGDTIHIHNHFMEREVLQTYQRQNGRLRSRMGPS